MKQKVSNNDLKKDIIDLKDFDKRQFETFTENFYLIKQALRYFSVEVGMSFTSTKISKNFPMTANVAGSSLTMLEKLEVVEPRNSSASPKRYRPSNVDLERLLEVENVLKQSLEIRDFTGNMPKSEVS